jgi:hypothetical protein
MHERRPEDTIAANTEPLKNDLQKSVDDLRKLGDEIRKEVQVASADAKKRWTEFFEPQLQSAGKFAHEVSGASREALNRTTAAFKEFKESLKKNAPVAKEQPKK